MKRKVVIGLAAYFVVFLLASAFLIRSIRITTENLDRLLTLHQVEILREHYLLQIRKVQSDLTSKHTRYSKRYDKVISNVVSMGMIIDTCFSCHHKPHAEARLHELKQHTEEYKLALSRVLTIEGSEQRIVDVEDAAFNTGEHLIQRVQEMIALTTSRLQETTQKALDEVVRTKYILYGLVALGPLVSTGLGLLFLLGLTRPVNVLVESTRKLKGGDLDHRVVGLKDEFGELGESFNAMAGSIQDQMHQMKEAESILEKANEELKRMQEQLVRNETMAALGTLSSGISHELTTPLSVILNMVQLIKRDLREKAVLSQDLGVIEEEANQAIRITRSLLGFAKTPKSQREYVSINGVLGDLQKILRFQPTAKSITVVSDPAPDLIPIWANAGQIRQVFLNLFLNAVQAMPDGGELRLATRNRPDEPGGGVEAIVADTGQGIPMELRKDVFKTFFTTKDQGTGLGLAIAYGVIREHNGRIDLESEAGKGTTFRVFLPAGTNQGGVA